MTDETPRKPTRRRRSTKRKPGSDKSSADESGSETRASHGDATPSDAKSGDAENPPKRSLPAFGFASDLLGDGPKTGDAEENLELDETELAELATVEGRERIFDFADRLTAHAQSDEEKAVRRRLEPWITCALDDELYGLPVTPVREVLRVTDITRVPHAPRPIRGVTHVRGRVIPVIDLRRRLQLEPAPLDRSSRIVVVAARQRLIGLLVDAVYQVVQVDLDKIEQPPEDVMTHQSEYIHGVYPLGEQLILLLDVEQVLIIHEASGAA